MAGRNAAKTVANMKKALERMGQSKGFDGVLSKCKVVESSSGLNRCTVSFKIDESHVNGFGTLHGGLSATLVDCISTLALVDESDDFRRFGVSTNMNMTYLSAGKLGEEIHIEGRALKVGKRLAYLDCELRKAQCGTVIASGTHTKFVG